LTGRSTGLTRSSADPRRRPLASVGSADAARLTLGAERTS